MSTFVINSNFCSLLADAVEGALKAGGGISQALFPAVADDAGEEGPVADVQRIFIEEEIGFASKGRKRDGQRVTMPNGTSESQPPGLLTVHRQAVVAAAGDPRQVRHPRPLATLS